MRRSYSIGVILSITFLVPLISAARAIPEVGDPPTTARGIVLGTTSVCPNLSRNLSYGMQGQDVRELQNFLIEIGDLRAGLNTGNFREQTRIAVRKFQCREMQICSGSEATTGYGSVGPKTRDAIKRVCSNVSYSQATYYSQGGYNTYSQGSYYSEANYYAQGSYNGYSQASYYSQGAYYSQGTYYSQAGYYSQGSYTPTVTRANQKMAINANNVYSPEVVNQGGQRYLYFGGWMNQGQTHDNIYRAQCGNLGDNCTGMQAVIDSFANGLEHFNDPTIVRMPGGYYILYGTGVAAGEDGFVVTNNKIYYSTSWVNDGVTWSAPTLLVTDAWLPSATIGPDGGVEVFGNSTVNGLVTRYRLGASGINIQGTDSLIFSNGLNYLNVDIKYRSNIGLYQMFGERFDTKHIDYLTSSDGIHFTLAASDIVTDQSAGVPYIRTPGQDSDTAQWLYYAGTNDPGATQNKIYFQTWSLQ